MVEFKMLSTEQVVHLSAAVQTEHPLPQAVQAPAFEKYPDPQVVHAVAEVHSTHPAEQAVQALFSKKNPSLHSVHSSTVQLTQFP